MYKNYSPEIIGFVLGGNGQLFSAVERDAWEPKLYANPLTTYKDTKDDFALALYARMLAVNLLEGPGIELGAYYIKEARHGQVIVSNGLEKAIKMLADDARRRKSVSSAKAFGKVIEEVEQTGDPVFVEWGGTWWYVTWLWYHPSNVFMNVYGPYPAEALKLKRRLGVAVPLSMTLGKVSSEILALKESMAMYYPFNIPVLKLQLDITHGVPSNVASLMEIPYPGVYVRVPNPDEFFYPLYTITYHCPAIPHPDAVAEYGDLIIRKFGVSADLAERKKIYDALVGRCREAGKKLMFANAVSHHIASWVLPITVPLMNATYWLAKYETERFKYVGGLVKTLATTFASEMMRSQKDVTPLYRMHVALNYFATGFASLMSFVMSVRPFVEGSPSYVDVNAAVGWIPTNVISDTPVEVKYGTETVIPVLITYGRENVHPGYLHYGYWRDGHFYHAVYTSREDFIKMLETLYFRRIVDGNAEHPADYEEVEILKRALWNGDIDRVIPNYEVKFMELFETAEETIASNDTLQKVYTWLISQGHLGTPLGWRSYLLNVGNEVAAAASAVNITVNEIIKRVLK
ncbi:hypothetical protein [Pyrobaculum sp.]|uniref:hypothetical protein n=1 Tax=Pyrobaculum sp. TaxID=2004705 RepID=UPI003D14C22E